MEGPLDVGVADGGDDSWLLCVVGLLVHVVFLVVFVVIDVFVAAGSGVVVVVVVVVFVVTVVTVVTVVAACV